MKNRLYLVLGILLVAGRGGKWSGSLRCKCEKWILLKKYPGLW
jgi:hypothetical protein